MNVIITNDLRRYVYVGCQHQWRSFSALTLDPDVRCINCGDKRQVSS